MGAWRREGMNKMFYVGQWLFMLGMWLVAIWYNTIWYVTGAYIALGGILLSLIGFKKIKKRKGEK